MEGMETVISEELHRQIQKIDSKYWRRKIVDIFNHILKYKKLSNKAPFLVDLYATYLQLIEILFLNVFCLRWNSLTMIFLNNNELRKSIENTFFEDIDNKKFKEEALRSIANNMFLGNEKNVQLNDREEKLNDYVSFLKEIIEDYLADYDLLNAFKHGFRITASGENKLRISANNSHRSFEIGSYSASISYLSKEKLSKEKDLVCEHKLSFNYERIIVKCNYLVSMLENIKKIEDAVYKHKPIGEISHMKITDRKKIAESFGNLRWKIPLYELKSKKK